MRILYVLSGTGARGGATKSFMVMAEAAAAAGHEIAVIVPDDKGIVPVLRQHGWEVVVTSHEFCALPQLSGTIRDMLLFIPRFFKRGWRNYKAEQRALAFARRFKPDIVHENTSVTGVGHYVAAKMKCPLVVHIREYGWKDFRLVLPGLSRRMRGEHTYLVAITSALAAYRGKDIDSSHLRVIYNGIVQNGSFVYDEDKDDFFLFAGRIEQAKGVDELIKSYIDYAEEQISAGLQPLRLWLAGECRNPDFKKKLQTNLETKGLEKYVEWLGPIANISLLYEKAAATVIPSYNEGFGRVMAEATASGSLCIVRDSGGLSEQLRNGIEMTGQEIALSFKDIGELTEELKRVSAGFSLSAPYRERGEFYEMIMRARDVVTELYTTENNGIKILDYYGFIINSEKSRKSRIPLFPHC